MSRRRLLAALLALGALVVACGSSAASDDGLTGRILVSGSSTVEPITALNAELFHEQHPQVEMAVDGPGTGDGFERFCDGETDISDASRPIAEEEVERCEDNGVEYVELRIGIDGIAVLTNPRNEDVGSCLSFSDIYAIVGPESQGFGDWSDANGLAAEVAALDDVPATQSAPFRDVPLTVVGPGEESGTFDTFVELVIADIAHKRGADETTRPDYTSSPNDNVIVQGIADSPTSLGWAGYAFYLENEDALKAFEIDGGDGCVAPTDDAIASGDYALARPLFIYVNTRRAETSPALREFIDFYLSSEGKSSVSEVGYVELTDAAWADTRSVWESR